VCRGDLPERKTFQSKCADPRQAVLFCEMGCQCAAIVAQHESIGNVPTDAVSLPAKMCHCGLGALADPVSLELGQDSKHAEDHLPRCGNRIDALTQADEIGTTLGQPFTYRDRVFCGTGGRLRL